MVNANKHSTADNKLENDFFDRPSTIKWILRIFYSVCIILVVIDFLIHRHIESSIEKIPAFYAIYGFVACVVLVLIANQMRKVLMRDEHYYESELTKTTNTVSRSHSIKESDHDE